MSDKFPASWYDQNCTQCVRLTRLMRNVKTRHDNYFCKPVSPFGVVNAELLIVGLAPGKHGANATGRPFTGDHAGILLYQTLYKFGFASGPVSSHVQDALRLQNCRITNAVKCLPPQNKPTGDEEKNCNHFLSAEISQPNLKVILALGLLAHRSILRSLSLRLNRYQFGHNKVHTLDSGIRLINSYHCSRYNTQTRRLTASMFDDVFHNIQSELNKRAS